VSDFEVMDGLLSVGVDDVDDDDDDDL